ncbi:MAG TPA: ABC transporter substrate-binding protein [Bacillales bacterium]|nr:ABC transporter substrate-binding protein [Bacillales bacterium]
MKKGTCYLLIVALILLLTACTSPQSTLSGNGKDGGSSSQADENADTAENAKPQPGGTLVISDLSGAQKLDPHTVTGAAGIHYLENMYNTLFDYKEGTYGELEGELVKDYEVSEDGLTYTFTLHDNVKFHNGDPLTSEDVKYSINRIKKLKVRASQFSMVKSIETPSDTKVVITLKQKTAPFLTFLANPVNAIVNKTVVEANGGSLDAADGGSGPFKMVEWTKGNQLVLAKFDDYFVEGKPYLDKVIWKNIPDATARNTALRNGEININLQLTPKDVKLLKKADGVKVDSVTGSYWEYIGLNVKHGPLKKKKVRQAIAWAVDREALNKVVKFGQAEPLTNGPIPPGHWAHSDEAVYPKQNIDKAKQLLKEAGYPDGVDLQMIVSPNESQVNAAQVIKQQVKEAGINIEVKQLESSVFFNKLGKHDFQMAVVGWVGFVDPDEFLYNIFHTRGQYNQQDYSNPKVDALLEKGRTTLDREKRKEIYAKAQKIIAQDAPMVFLYANTQSSGLTENVHGFDVNPTVSTKSLVNTWLSK